MAGIDDPNGVLMGSNPRPMTTFRVLVNPLVPWIWLGGIIMALGTLIAIWPAEGNQPTVRRVPARARPEAGTPDRELVEA